MEDQPRTVAAASDPGDPVASQADPPEAPAALLPQLRRQGACGSGEKRRVAVPCLGAPLSGWFKGKPANHVRLLSFSWEFPFRDFFPGGLK